MTPSQNFTPFGGLYFLNLPGVSLHAYPISCRNHFARLIAKKVPNFRQLTRVSSSPNRAPQILVSAGRGIDRSRYRQTAKMVRGYSQGLSIGVENAKKFQGVAEKIGVEKFSLGGRPTPPFDPSPAKLVGSLGDLGPQLLAERDQNQAVRSRVIREKSKFFWGIW